MKKAKILNSRKTQIVILPKVYFSNPNEIIFQEHELGVLLIDPEKRWKLLEEVLGSMEDDFFPKGRDFVSWTKRIKLK